MWGRTEQNGAEDGYHSRDITFLEMVNVLWIVTILGRVTIIVMVTIIRDGDHHKGW